MHPAGLPRFPIIPQHLWPHASLDPPPQVKADPFTYDHWFDYVRLEESALAIESDYHRTRDVYERAIANVPPAADKRLWRRYVYLWLKCVPA